MENKTNNAICPICRKPFRICRTCETKGITSWKTVTDTENCFSIFTTVHQYNVAKSITKDEAKAKLKSCNLSEIGNYPETLRKVIMDINKEDKVIKENKAMRQTKNTASKAEKTTNEKE